MSDTITNHIGKSQKKAKSKITRKKTTFQSIDDEVIGKDYKVIDKIHDCNDYMDYGWKYLTKFLQANVGKHIDEVYSEYKKIIDNNPHMFGYRHYNHIHVDPKNGKKYINWMLIDENGILREENLHKSYNKRQKEKRKDNPYYATMNDFEAAKYTNLTETDREYLTKYGMHRRAVKFNFIFVKNNKQEYIYNKDKRTWFECTSEQVVNSLYNETIFKLRTLNKKEIKELNLNKILDYDGQFFNITNKVME